MDENVPGPSVAEETACFGCPVSVIFVAHSFGVQTQP